MKFSIISKISKISKIWYFHWSISLIFSLIYIVDIFVLTLTFVHVLDCLLWKQSEGSVLVEILYTPGSCSDAVVNSGVISWNVSRRSVFIESVRCVVWRRNVHRQTFLFIIINNNKISGINLMLRLRWTVLVTFFGWWCLFLYVFWTLPANNLLPLFAQIQSAIHDLVVNVLM